MRTAPTAPTVGAERSSELLDPTPDEKRNGWTAETLTKYHAERLQAQSEVALNTVDQFGIPARGQKRPSQANSKYSPHRWRGA